jgi:hypothetical protein
MRLLVLDAKRAMQIVAVGVNPILVNVMRAPPRASV